MLTCLGGSFTILDLFFLNQLAWSPDPFSLLVANPNRSERLASHTDTLRSGFTVGQNPICTGTLIIRDFYWTLGSYSLTPILFLSYYSFWHHLWWTYFEFMHLYKRRCLIFAHSTLRWHLFFNQNCEVNSKGITGNYGKQMITDS